MRGTVASVPEELRASGSNGSTPPALKPLGGDGLADDLAAELDHAPEAAGEGRH